jgi:hypothetical protein
MEIGFFLPNIVNDSYHNNILENINNLCEIRPYDNIIVFNNYFHTIHDNKKYYVLSINHAKYFSGILFVFNTQDAFLTKTFPGPNKQIIYLDKPEWSMDQRMPFTVWHNIYMSNKFEIIASNKELYSLVDICWKKPLKQISNFNYKDIDNVLRSI